jgi:membrane protease YdiL (CAAX protease family)
VVTTGALGAVLTQLYLATGSLLLPMVLHVLIDLQSLLVRRPAPTAAPLLADAR